MQIIKQPKISVEIGLSIRGLLEGETIKLTEDNSRQLLINDLTKGAYLSSQNLSCRSDIGLYLFKVDSKGKIHEKDI